MVWTLPTFFEQSQWIHSFFWFDDWLPNKPILTSGMNTMFMSEMGYFSIYSRAITIGWWLFTLVYCLSWAVGYSFKAWWNVIPSFQMESTIAVLFVPSVVFWSSGVIKNVWHLVLYWRCLGFYPIGINTRSGVGWIYWVSSLFFGFYGIWNITGWLFGWLSGSMYRQMVS